MTSAPPQGNRIPIPEDFPIAWQAPAEETLFWWWDQMHHPHSVTPLTLSLDGPAFSQGIQRAADILHMPVKRYHVRGFNTYWYFTYWYFYRHRAS